MSKQKNAGAVRQEEVLGGLTGAQGPVAVPRRWLVLVTALVTVPWLIAGAIYVSARVDPDAHEAPISARAGNVSIGAAGPWGRLAATPIVISPPLEYVPRNWGPVEPTLWHVPADSPESLTSFLTDMGLAADQIAALQATARPHSTMGGAVVRPSPALVRGLPSPVRARLYNELAKSPLNVDQQTSYRFFGTSTDAWLGPPISQRTRELVEPLIYRQGDFMYFADIELVRAGIEDPAELQLLAKRLFRQSTLLVSLSVEDLESIPAIAEYWGRGGRRVDVKPILESVAGAGAARSIDISHLLPALAREHLYRYPKVTVADHEKPLLANCLWTALNFFAADPDDRLLDVEVALERLKKDYYLVQDNFELGDIVAFSDRQGNIFHAGVYLADGLIFGKNGNSPLAPWSILPLERLKGHYIEHSDGWQVTYHRNKAL